jgi:hypothetical protein
MPTRREFIESGAVLLLMVPLADACSSASSPSSAGQGCNGVLSTSTVNAGHSHLLCVSASDLSSPPAAGMTYTSSASGSGPHTHTVTLLAVQLMQIQAGQSVTVTSSNNVGHTHDFSVSKM